MDGGSTDETLAVLARAPEHLQWRSEADRGQSHALNKALAESKGEIIGWLNSDDAYADRRAVERAVQLFELHPDVGAVYGHSLMIDARNRVLQYVWAPPHWNALLRRQTPFTQPAVFLRRSGVAGALRARGPELRDGPRPLAATRCLARASTASISVVGIDRHHGERKVESTAYLAERDEYYGSRNQRALNRATAKVIKVALRLRGLPDVRHLSRTLEPALSLTFDSSMSFALRQGLMPRRYMS